MKPFNKTKGESRQMEIGEWAFHGDVIIQRVESVPKNMESFKKTTDNELAFGEATGHLHEISGGAFDLRIDPQDETVRHLRVVEPVALRHQEHKEVIIYPGDYVTKIQREYDPFEKLVRRVID